MLDFLWMARNKILHENLRLVPFAILQQILHSHREHLAAWRIAPRLLHSIPCKSFMPGMYYRLTFDVVVQPSFSMCAAVLFHSNGDILRAWTHRSMSFDPLIGEAEEAFLPLFKACDLKLSSLLLQGDSAIVMECILFYQLQGLSACKLYLGKLHHSFTVFIRFFSLFLYFILL